ncbi:MAG TPA: DUF721 domain-containing protein [Gaiellaceae bacterium]
MESIRSAVEAELTRFGPAGRIAEVAAAWPEAVGEGIARNAWPARINRDGTLIVHTADSVWAFELQQRAVEIAERLGVKGVRFVPGPVPEADSEAEPAPPVEPTERDRLQAAALAEGIESSELREAVARAAAASLARSPSGRSVW